MRAYAKVENGTVKVTTWSTNLGGRVDIWQKTRLPDGWYRAKATCEDPNSPWVVNFGKKVDPLKEATRLRGMAKRIGSCPRAFVGDYGVRGHSEAERASTAAMVANRGFNLHLADILTEDARLKMREADRVLKNLARQV